MCDIEILNNYEFIFTKILSEDLLEKRVHLLGVLNRKQSDDNDMKIIKEDNNNNNNDMNCIITLQVTPVNTMNIEQLINNMKYEFVFRNDIYYQYKGFSSSSFMIVDIIYPTTQKHIDKYTAKSLQCIHETIDIYKQVHLPLIESIPLSRFQWVYNILDGKAEADRLLYEDIHELNGFKIFPNMKWNMERISELYCLIMVCRRDIRSIRDLKGEHIPLLENIYHKTCQFLKEKYKLNDSNLRFYFHYPPSYYHLHIHVAIMGFRNEGQAAGKAHLLHDVIENLRYDESYYQHRTITLFTSDDNYLTALNKKLLNE